MHQSCLLVIDLDNFKLVNDQFGHMQGDFVIQSFARIIREFFDSTDIVSRFGAN